MAKTPVIGINKMAEVLSELVKAGLSDNQMDLFYSVTSVILTRKKRSRERAVKAIERSVRELRVHAEAISYFCTEW